MLLPLSAQAQHYDVIDSLVLKQNFRTATVTRNGVLDRQYTCDKKGRLVLLLERVKWLESEPIDSILYTYSDQGVRRDCFRTREKTWQYTEQLFHRKNSDSLVTMNHDDTMATLITRQVTDTGLVMVYRDIYPFVEEDSVMFYYRYHQKRLVKYGIVFKRMGKPSHIGCELAYNDYEKNCTLDALNTLYQERYYFDKKGRIYKLELWPGDKPVDETGEVSVHKVYDILYKK